MMKRIVHIVFLGFSLCTYLKGQELSFGSESVVDQVKEKTSWIYENKDETHFFLTRQRLQKSAVYGLNITAHSLENKVNRLITVGTTKDGQLSTEWYFHAGQLIFVYQVFEFFDESKKKDSWKNFKGLYGWESRYYFVNGKLKYHKHKGRNDIDWQFKEGGILKAARSILNYVNAQIAEKK